MNQLNGDYPQPWQEEEGSGAVGVAASSLRTPDNWREMLKTPEGQEALKELAQRQSDAQAWPSDLEKR